MLNNKFIYLRNAGVANPFMSMANGGGGGGKGGGGGDSGIGAMMAQQSMQMQMDKLKEENSTLSAAAKAAEGATQVFKPAESGLDPIMQPEARNQTAYGQTLASNRGGTRGLRINLAGTNTGSGGSGLNI